MEPQTTPAINSQNKSAYPASFAPRAKTSECEDRLEVWNGMWIGINDAQT